MRLAAALQGVTRLAIDTPPFIYFVESHPQYLALVAAVFRQIDLGELEAITSVVALGEALVQPLRDGNLELRRRFRDRLLDSPGLRTVDIDSTVAERAAGLRARYGVRLPDALQLAIALEQGCEAFLTNDRRLARVAEPRVLVLDDLEP
jgi:predicted nucleic acid-binding protein